jgi:hypothetical protein
MRQLVLKLYQASDLANDATMPIYEKENDEGSLEKAQ